MGVETATPLFRATDGRRARRDRGRLAVTEAMIDLVLEGYLPPSAEQVARRAGVSVASLFRYFETLDELRRETIRRFLERFAHLLDIPEPGLGPLPERIERFVAARLTLYATTEPIGRLARSRASSVPDFDRSLSEARAATAMQVRQHFATELDRRSPARRDDLVAVICTTTSFESWLQFRDDHARSASQTRRAWTNALRCLLDPP